MYLEVNMSKYHETKEAYFVRVKYVNPETNFEVEETFIKEISTQSNKIKCNHDKAYDMVIAELRSRFNMEIRPHWRRIDYI
jgi:hypothetical protein